MKYLFQVSRKNFDDKDSLTSKCQNSQSGEKCDGSLTFGDNNDKEEDMNEDENSLNEFLTHAAEIKIKNLQKKCANLEEILVMTQEKYKNMVHIHDF